MDGVVIIDKPAGLTSHDVVVRLRHLLGTRRIGHTGTLDPFATGVLVMLVGRATRLAKFLADGVKEYEAVVRFGFETDTGDRTGTRSAECGLTNGELAVKAAAADWESVFEKFRGDILQVPPMYSAKKIEGRKLYELARKGLEVERKPERVTIHALERLSGDGLGPSEMRIRVGCSAGTYIRTLAEDIGRESGLMAHLAELRRTRAGEFDLSQAVTLDELEARRDVLLPMAAAVSHLSAATIPDERIERTRNGLASRIRADDLYDGQAVRIVDGRGELLAVGEYREDEMAVQPKVVLI